MQDPDVNSDAAAVNDETPLSDPPGTLTLRRALGPRIAMAVVVGNVIGSGIFLKPGAIAAECGHFGLIVSVWIFGGLLCVLGALYYAELATMLPQAGGLYVYLREAYGKPTAFLFGWSEFLFSRPASIGPLSVAFLGSLALALGWQMSAAAEVMLATLLIAAMAWINIIGVIWGGRLQMLTTVVKVFFLALVAGSPVLLAPWSGWTIEAANYASTVTPKQANIVTQVGAVLLAVTWAYNGWSGITPLTARIANRPMCLNTSRARAR